MRRFTVPVKHRCELHALGFPDFNLGADTEKLDFDVGLLQVKEGRSACQTLLQHRQGTSIVFNAFDRALWASADQIREVSHQVHVPLMDEPLLLFRGKIKLALDLGWTPECGSNGLAKRKGGTCNLAPTIRFIGYDGYPNHDTRNHLHISWRCDCDRYNGALRGPAYRVWTWPRW